MKHFVTSTIFFLTLKTGLNSEIMPCFLMWQLLLWSPDHHCDSQHHHHHSNKLFNSILSFSNSFVSSFIFTVAVWQRGVNETKLNEMRKTLIFKPLVLYNTHRAQNTAHFCLPRGTVVVVVCLYLFVKVTHSSECFTVLPTVRWEVKNKQSLLTSRYKIKQRKSNVLFRDELSSLSHLTGHQCFIFTDVTFEEGAESGSEICGSQSVSLLYWSIWWRGLAALWQVCLSLNSMNHLTWTNQRSTTMCLNTTLKKLYLFHCHMLKEATATHCGVWNHSTDLSFTFVSLNLVQCLSGGDTQGQTVWTC